jgi:hypothetical protein
MKPLKIVVIGAIGYVAIVVAFESLIGYFQPADASTLVITTLDPDGSSHDRVVSQLESDGKLYVAANHWPRAWFDRALENPLVRITIDDKTEDRRAIPVTGDEHEQVNADNALPVAFRVLTGFPPRNFVRLDPR